MAFAAGQSDVSAGRLMQFYIYVIFLYISDLYLFSFIVIYDLVYSLKPYTHAFVGCWEYLMRAAAATGYVEP